MNYPYRNFLNRGATYTIVIRKYLICIEHVILNQQGHENYSLHFLFKSLSAIQTQKTRENI